MSDRDWPAIAGRLLNEGLISLSEAAKLLPPARRRNGGVRHCSAAALMRWILGGKRGVYLEGCRGTGKTWWTSRPAVIRFLAALSGREVAAHEATDKLVPTPAGERDQVSRGQAAMAILERLRKKRAG
jgi:hypothetical protein